MFSKSFMKRVTWLLPALSLILALAPAPAVHAAAIHYARSNGVTSGTCATWATACTLTYALTQAVAGDQIWIAQGIYRPATTGNRSASFTINRNVTLYGGFPPAGTPILSDRNPTLYPTVLSGDQAGDDVTNGAGVVLDWPNLVGSDNSYSVINLQSTATLDGLIVTGGYGDSSHPGGGIISWGGATNAVLQNMVFRGNRSDGPGGAIYLYNGTGPLTIQDTKFIGNAALQGGAVQIMMVTVTFNRVLFQDNDAAVGSGAAHIGGAVNGQGGNSAGDTSHPWTFTDVQFIGNSGDNSGAVDILYGSATMNNVIFQGNHVTAGNGVGGFSNSLANATVTNAVFVGNGGAGLYNNGGTMMVTNVSAWGNAWFGIASAGTIQIRNSISWGNGSSAFYNWSGSATVRYSIIQGGYAGTNVLNSDPAFVSPATGDLHLLPSSPAIDAGDNTVASPALPGTDLDGITRKLDFIDVADTGLGTAPIVDMGAYEFDGIAPDLIATKTNNVGGVAALGTPFNWTITVRNRGYSSAANFANTQVILRDNLPGTGATYGTPIVQNTTSLTGTIGCAIASNNLNCSASGAVSLAALNGRFDVVIPVTPTVVSSLANPRSGGVCSADPNSVVTESRETNNTCSDSVIVIKATPTLVTEIHNASHTVITSAPISTTVHGKATLSGPIGFALPTGTATLALYNNATCTAPAVTTDTKTLLADGTAESSAISAQSFYYQVTYAGDANYNPATGSCALFSAYQPGPTFTVNTTADDTGDSLCSDVHCTLREAITAANAYGSAATINFSVSGTFTPTTAFPSLNHVAGATTLDGSGQTINISGTLEFATTSTISGSLTVNHLQIDNGVTLAASAGSTLNMLGNWANNGGTFNAGTGTVTFSGSGVQLLTANSATVFNNLTVNNGVLLIETVSADNVTVAGTLTNSGTIRKSQPVAGTGLKTFGLAGAHNGGALSINVVAQAGMSNLQVDRIDSNHPNATYGPGNGTSTGRWWNITQTDGSGYVVDLTLPHTVVPDTNADVCEYTAGPGYGWDCDRTSSTSNTVTRQNVTTLSPWAVGDNTGPTAIALTEVSVRSSDPASPVRWLVLSIAVLMASVLIGVCYRRRVRA